MTKFWKPILAVLLVCTLALSGGALLACLYLWAGAGRA